MDSSVDRDLSIAVVDILKLIEEADHSQNGEWSSWEVQSYASVLKNLVKEYLETTQGST